MGNELGATLIERLKNSELDTTLLSKQDNPPVFIDPTELPGVARAWVVFKGIVPNPSPKNFPCQILKKSSNVIGVSSGVQPTAITPTVGEYYIALAPGTFTDIDYLVSGSITPNTNTSVTPSNAISAANTFFLKNSGTDLTSFNYAPTLTSFKIQTFYSTFNTVSSRYAYADKVSLILYK
jgi:hypothetical protein